MRSLDGIGREGIAPGLVECVRARVTYFKPGGTPLNGSQPVTCVDERFTCLLYRRVYHVRSVHPSTSTLSLAHCASFGRGPSCERTTMAVRISR